MNKLFFLIILLLPFSLPAESSITFSDLKIFPADTENINVKNMREQILTILEQDYDGYLKVMDKGRTDYLVSLNIFIDENQNIATLKLTENSSNKEKVLSLPFIYGFDTPLYMARSIFYLWSSLNGYLKDKETSPPVFIDALRTEFIKDTVIPEINTILIPMDMAVKRNGNFLAAFSLISTEIDPQFRILGQPGRSLFENGDYTSSAGISVTPLDTVFLKPSMGRYIYKVSRDTGEISRIRTPSDLYGPFTVLRDGSVIILDIQKKKAFRITGRKRRELRLFTSPYSYISALETGPEGNIWTYDIAEKRIKIHSPEGEIIDSLIPVIDEKTGTAPVDLSVYGDGSFIVLYSSGTLAKFSREGIPVWESTGFTTPSGVESFPVSGKIAADGKHGIIFIADTTGKRLIKLMESGADNPDERLIIELNRRTENPGAAAAEKAVIYEKHGSLEMSRQLWEDSIEYGYSEETAFEAMDRLEIEIIRNNINMMKEKTLSVLRDLGRESARQYYTKTIQMYEKILFIDPGRNEIRTEKTEFENLFNSREIRNNPEPMLTVENIQIEDLFPSLIQYYLNNPAGYVTVRNGSDNDIRIIKSSFFIKDFMDYSSDSDSGLVLAPGEDTELKIYPLFNRSVLDLEEDLPVKAVIEVEFESGDGKEKTAANKTVVIHRRSAISWRDSGRLASFITPNDENVEIFSHRASSADTEKQFINLPDKFLQGMKIAEALGKYGIKYTRDPDSPAESVIGFPEKIDTVRFPRKTLLIHSGDCDDSTSLLASLLESGGIETAVITSPGHVFLAFNTEEPKQNRWMFSTPETSVITYSGTIWIPLETTALNSGFTHSWILASREYSKYSNSGKTEFLPVRKLWRVYPPVPLKKSIYAVLPPSEEDISEAMSRSLSVIEKKIYNGVLSRLKSDEADSAGRRKITIKNRMGILHARFGFYKPAEKEFMECIGASPEYSPAYMNLINLYTLSGKRSDLNRIMAMIKKQNPELEIRLAETDNNNKDESSISRASDKGGGTPVIWTSE